jgi:hypothetical protein
MSFGMGLLEISDGSNDVFGSEASPSIRKTNLSSSAQLTTLIGMRPSMLKRMLAGDTRIFRDWIRAGDGGVGYSRENVWRHKAADGILLDLLHDRG